MYPYTRKHLILMVMTCVLLVPMIVMGLLVGIFAFVAYQCDLPMGVSTYPWEFILLCSLLAFVVGVLNASMEYTEYVECQIRAREAAARKAMWSDWDEALYACEVMHSTRNRAL